MQSSSSTSWTTVANRTDNGRRWRANPSTVAGAGAGLVSSIVTCPLDVIKTRLQAQRAATGRTGYLGIVGALFHVEIMLCLHADVDGRVDSILV